MITSSCSLLVSMHQGPLQAGAICKLSLETHMTLDCEKMSVRWPSATRLCSSAITNTVLHDASNPATYGSTALQLVSKGREASPEDG